MDTYITSIDTLEQSVLDDNIYPKVRSSKCKAFCFVVSECAKECIKYFKISRYNNNATQESKRTSQGRSKTYWPNSTNWRAKIEVQVKQNVIICDKCNHRIPVQNEMQIDKKGVKLKCLPCSFKSSRKSKTTSDSTKKDGGEEILSSTEGRLYAMASNRDFTAASNREHRRAVTNWWFLRFLKR